jgi:hypothetical protein
VLLQIDKSAVIDTAEFGESPSIASDGDSLIDEFHGEFVDGIDGHISHGQSASC